MTTPLSSGRSLKLPHPDPARDWFVALAVSIIVLAGITVWNAWAFDTIAAGGIIGPPAPSTAPVFSKTSLDAIRAIFDERAAEESKYLSGAYSYTDPSL